MIERLYIKMLFMFVYVRKVASQAGFRISTFYNFIILCLYFKNSSPQLFCKKKFRKDHNKNSRYL